eukprot:TRINITY_DN3100_c0_g1_i6.p1 TRINITY_DN3100_c0_g1~~TRINITY_DN3100_c0_g1_i6.p1  ORF type:complete len:297 (-),score=64.15 TRINITY_DN3100_c0_g1_i6:12-902(-)
MSKGDAVGVPHSVVLEILRTKYDIAETDGESMHIRVDISSLPSYDDQNFRVKRTTRDKKDESTKADQFVLKIANKYEVYEALDLQNKTMGHLKSKGVTAPYVIPSNTNEMILSVQVFENEPPRLVRLLSFLEGKVLSQAKNMPKELFVSIGKSLAELDQALSDFEHPAAIKRGEELDWNLANAARVLADIDAIRHYESKERVQIVEKIREKFVETAKRFDELPNGVVQGDANEGNIIINHDETAVVGFIDYGDAALVKRVFDLAIVLAYSMLPSANKSYSHTVSYTHLTLPTILRV